MGWTNPLQWIIILVVVLLLFGRGKIPALMGDMAKGIKAFKSGMKEEAETPAKAIDPDAETAADDTAVKKDEAAQG